MRPRENTPSVQRLVTLVTFSAIIISYAARFAIVLASCSRPRTSSSRSAATAAFVGQLLGVHAQQSSSSPTSFFVRGNTCAWTSTTTSSVHTSTSSGSMCADNVKSPPVARRDEDGVVWAGVAPEGWDIKIPRQSESSAEKLIDPPVSVP